MASAKFCQLLPTMPTFGNIGQLLTIFDIFCQLSPIFAHFCHLLPTFPNFCQLFCQLLSTFFNFANFANYANVANYANFWQNLATFVKFRQLLPNFANLWQLLATIIMSPCHLVNHHVILLYCYPAISSSCQFVRLSICQPVGLSARKLVSF